MNYSTQTHTYIHTHTHLALSQSVLVQQIHSVVHSHQADLRPWITSDLETKALSRRVVSRYAVCWPDRQL